MRSRPPGRPGSAARCRRRAAARLVSRAARAAPRAGSSGCWRARRGGRRRRPRTPWTARDGRAQRLPRAPSRRTGPARRSSSRWSPACWCRRPRSRRPSSRYGRRREAAAPGRRTAPPPRSGCARRRASRRGSASRSSMASSATDAVAAEVDLLHPADRHAAVGHLGALEDAAAAGISTLHRVRRRADQAPQRRRSAPRPPTTASPPTRAKTSSRSRTEAVIAVPLGRPAPSLTVRSRARQGPRAGRCRRRAPVGAGGVAEEGERGQVHLDREVDVVAAGGAEHLVGEREGQDRLDRLGQLARPACAARRAPAPGPRGRRRGRPRTRGSRGW